ncbi:SRPBCC family protein [Halobacillus massiliensis]|uniref:SRPBCC family protein n=1 Tax=Halobacillus massiliensis TaxID=1926286 RepID=UPI0009E3C291|nr:SRPBCC family protein [Halobacillus massiliensis]
MAFLEQQVLIKKPLDEVFHTAVDFTKRPEIMDMVIKVEPLTEGPVREGYKFKEVREIRGKKAAAVIEIVEFSPQKSFTAQSEQNGLELRYHYHFLETSEGTRVTFKGELSTEGLRNSLFKPLIKKMIKKEDENHLENMKHYIEKQ